MNVVNLLVSNPAIVLQDVEVLCSDSGGNLLCNGKKLCERVVGNVCELFTMELGDDKLMEGDDVNTAILLHDSGSIEY